MLSNKGKTKVNKSCVYCGSKVKDSHYVLSDESYIHKECLEILQLSIANNQLDQEMRQFYDFILSKVVNCNTCKSPLDILHNNYMTLPLCTKCNPFNNFLQKVEVKACQLCDQQITQKNQLKKPPIIEGIIMCRACYNLQTGQIQQSLQEKPDLRAKKKEEPLFNYRAMKNASINNNNDNVLQKMQKNYNNCKKFEEFKPRQCRICLREQSMFNSVDKFKNVCHDCQNPSLNKKAEKLFPDSSIKIQVQPQAFQMLKIEDIEGYDPENYGLIGLFEEEQIIQATKISQNQIKNIQQKKQQETKKTEKLEVNKHIELKVQPEQTHKYSLKECKICFNAQSQMMNKECRHMMMCEACYKLMLKRQNKKKQLCCPVCQTVGKYFKYLEPIYI